MARVSLRRRVRLADEVAEELRQRIYMGEYAVGTPLRQEQLAEDLEVSRTPLREAIRVIEREGLLQGERNRTVRVVTADRAKLIAAYQMREVLDGLAARLAASCPDDSRGEALMGIVSRQEATMVPYDKPAYMRANIDFHAALIEFAGNEFLEAQMPLVQMSGQVFAPVTLFDPGDTAIAVEQHRQIVAAVLRGNGREAEELARAHIRTTIEKISELSD